MVTIQVGVMSSVSTCDAIGTDKEGIWEKKNEENKRKNRRGEEAKDPSLQSPIVKPHRESAKP